MTDFFQILFRLAFKYQELDEEEWRLETVNEDQARKLLLRLMRGLLRASQVQGLHIADSISALTACVIEEVGHPEYQPPGKIVTSLLEAAAREAEIGELP